MAGPECPWDEIHRLRDHHRTCIEEDCRECDSFIYLCTYWNVTFLREQS